MKLKLPVTLVAVDCVTPLETLKSIHYMLKSVEFEEVVFVTRPGHVTVEFQEVPIRIIESEQGGRLDYEDFVLRKLHTCFRSAHCLFMEWDSGIVNSNEWLHTFLYYDWIGAPWQYPEDLLPDYPPTTAENCVGNGGFSLRSRRLCEAVAAMVPEGEPNIALSDVYICRTRRKELEELGMRFAPFEVAERFSCENKIYSGQFGFHGKSTIELNGWRWDIR